jgi:hypothetical protein
LWLVLCTTIAVWDLKKLCRFQKSCLAFKYTPSSSGSFLNGFAEKRLLGCCATLQVQIKGAAYHADKIAALRGKPHAGGSPSDQSFCLIGF